ncbi:acyl-CoA dehydrogenase family protein [Streptomyces sp. NPDC002513]
MTSLQSATDLVPASAQLAARFAKSAAAVDAAGEYPSDNLKDLHEAGFSRLSVPRELGGIASPGRYQDLPVLTRILTNIAGAESSTAQIWMVSHSVAANLLGPWSPLSEDRRHALAREVLEGARFCSAASERVKPRFSYRTTATPASGGVTISGTKRFATGVKGATYAITPVLHSDFDSIEAGGLHWALVRLDSPGVRVIDDWDNMGQRATGSCSVEFTDVFVPDGYHWAPPVDIPAHHDVSGPVFQVQFAAILLGIGKGALEAITPYLSSAPPSPTGADNPFDVSDIAEWQIGQHYLALRAAQALIDQAVTAIAQVTPADEAERAAISIDMICAKVSATEASLALCADIHRMGGGRSTTRLSGLDMYWRNARTLSTHDPQDVKKRHLGRWVIRHTNPPIDALT